MERYNLQQIRDYWTRQAVQWGRSSSASWSDRMVMEMEVHEIGRRLSDGDRVLDIGCANGFSTIRFAQHKELIVRGLDYIPEMVDQARLQLKDADERVRRRIQFEVGDITALQEPSEAYDKIIVIRVLINLQDWDRQVLALRECIRVLRRGGRLLLSEATMQGWLQLNRFRREWGLPDIPMPPFNLYVDQDAVVQTVAPELELIEISDFASSYYVGTRVLKPLLAKALGAPIDVSDPNMEWNRWCAQLPAAGNYGTQKLFVFEKR